MKNRFARFAIVGFIGVVAQLCFLTVFTNRFRFAPVPATAFAVELTILHNFLWHEHFTWSDRTSTQRLLRLWRFHLSNGGISLLGNTLLTYCFVTRLHARQVPSALAAIALCSLANFIFADRWVFPTPTTSSKACASSSVPQCGLRQSLRLCRRASLPDVVKDLEEILPRAAKQLLRTPLSKLGTYLFQWNALTRVKLLDTFGNRRLLD